MVIARRIQLFSQEGSIKRLQSEKAARFSLQDSARRIQLELSFEQEGVEDNDD
jgi:hypothetical protein